MKLRINKFEELAKRGGYRNGYELSLALGCGDATYPLLKKGGRIGGGIVAEIYNRFGEEITLEVIDFENETINSIKSKYIKVGNKLY